MVWDEVNDDLGLEWFRKYDSVFDPSAGLPWTRWFTGGKCNIVASAIDRHANENPDKVAYIFANEYGTKKVTYRELDIEVSRLAAAMAAAGIKKGDVVGIYLPMVPEAFYATFACSKIGAVHATVFSGFGGQALHSRLVDSKAKMLVTADVARRRGKEIDLKGLWSKAVEQTEVSKIVTVGGQATGNNTVVNYAEFVRNTGLAKTEVTDAEDPLFILYTSGTTGQPKDTLQVHGGFAGRRPAGKAPCRYEAGRHPVLECRHWLDNGPGVGSLWQRDDWRDGARLRRSS